MIQIFTVICKGNVSLLCGIPLSTFCLYAFQPLTPFLDQLVHPVIPNNIIVVSKDRKTFLLFYYFLYCMPPNINTIIMLLS